MKEFLVYCAAYLTLVGVMILVVKIRKRLRRALKIQSINVKEGQFGPYTVFSADGDSYSAFGRHHTAISRYKVGDEIDFKWEQKGNYKRVSELNGPGVSTSTGSNQRPPATSSSGGGGGYRKDPTEFNVMMATRYALDALIGNQASTPEEAVALIKSLYNGFIPKTEEVKESL